MRAYFVLGLGILILAAIAWFGLSRTSETVAPATSTAPTSTNLTHPMTPAPFSLTSPVFKDGGMIPSTYTCDDQRSLSPPLSVSGIPEGTKSLALIMEDPDVPKALIPEGVFVHWVVYNIPPRGDIPQGAQIGTPGANNMDNLAYTGPCPPPEYEPSTHRYIFTLYALSEELSFPKAPTAADLRAAVAGKTLGAATLVGKYSRK